MKNTRKDTAWRDFCQEKPYRLINVLQGRWVEYLQQRWMKYRSSFALAGEDRASNPGGQRPDVHRRRPPARARLTGRPVCFAHLEAFQPSFFGFDPFSFLFDRWFLVMASVFQLPEQTIGLHFPLEEPDGFFYIFIVNPYLQLFEFLPPPPPPPPRSNPERCPPCPPRPPPPPVRGRSV